jgi:hypothetical protein
MLRGGLLVVCVGCASPTTPAVAPEPAKVVPVIVEPTPVVPVVPAPTSVKQVGEGKCEPQPRAGAPCLAGDGFCVLSWGEPGGHSTALWCRGGRWEIEEEVNLPADEG